LCLKYDERARLAEYQYYRSDEADELEQSGDVDMELAALNAKLRGGGDFLHRICSVASFASTGSQRCHQHVLEQLETQNAGMGVVKKALEEFAALLNKGRQKEQLRGYLEAL
jgi:beta-catenin-like protein 1